jgi:hypothetical protein
MPARQEAHVLCVCVEKACIGTSAELFNRVLFLIMDSLQEIKEQSAEGLNRNVHAWTTAQQEQTHDLALRFQRKQQADLDVAKKTLEQNLIVQTHAKVAAVAFEAPLRRR